MEYFQFKVYSYYFGMKRAAYMHVTFSELGQCNKLLSLQIPPYMRLCIMVASI